MGILDFFKAPKENRTQIESRMRYGESSLLTPFENEKHVTEDEAMQIPSFSAAVDIITGAIATLDFYIVYKDENGETIRIEDDYRLKLLNNQPNEYTDSYTFKKAMVKDFLLYGVSNSFMEKTLNKTEGLYLMPSSQVDVKVFVKDGYKRYAETFVENASGRYKIDDNNLLSIVRDSDDGFTGKGILRQNEDVLRKAITLESYSTGVLKNGSLPMSVLQSERKLSDAVFNNLKASWEKLYQGGDNAGKTVILEEGLQYKPISLKPNDLELTESKKSSISDIARIFNIPETMINSNAGKYGSGEHNSIVFLQYCINPIVEAIEGALNLKMLLEEEKDLGWEFKIDPSKLLQMTRKEKAEAIGAEYEAGLISFWEARAEMNMSQLSEQDYFKLSLGDVLYKYADNEMVIPNTMQSKAALKEEETLVKEEVKIKDEGG